MSEHIEDFEELNDLDDLPDKVKCRNCGHIIHYRPFNLTERGWVQCPCCGLYTQVKEW